MGVAGLTGRQTSKARRFARLAEAMGFTGVRVEESADVGSGSRRILAHNGRGAT